MSQRDDLATPPAAARLPASATTVTQPVRHVPERESESPSAALQSTEAADAIASRAGQHVPEQEVESQSAAPQSIAAVDATAPPTGQHATERAAKSPSAAPQSIAAAAPVTPPADPPVAEPGSATPASDFEAPGSKSAAPVAVDAAPDAERAPVVERLWAVLREIEDPEIPVSLVDMGLIISIDYRDTDKTARLRITYTAMGCPAMDMIQDDIRARLVQEVDVENVEIDVVWDPVWTHRRLSPAARVSMRELGIAV